MHKRGRILLARKWNHDHMPDRIPLHDVHELVTGPFRGVGIVDQNTGSVNKGQEEICWVSIWRGTFFEKKPYDEKQLTGITLRHFMWFTHPRTGTWRIGNNPAIAFIVAMVLLVPASIYTAVVGSDPPWMEWIIYGLLVCMPLFFFGGAALQYYRIWK